MGWVEVQRVEPGVAQGEVDQGEVGLRARGEVVGGGGSGGGGGVGLGGFPLAPLAPLGVGEEVAGGDGERGGGG